ncbi:phosphatidylserine decarboxylase [Deinococcus sp. KSM4-11]|uniref:phosphatidylserine decarboxylase n=1 Tax=Deinococcus sp. KSM4-11 TaxID=2568654 RepID=UPI0010A3E1A7|nr:phosphatidylserine decarboxylase [Deinococcus sp. KSM4-11]THF84828.1 phosphatidylserine decarboxylase [Deinococcus sp. KSM4-11]
MRLRRLLPVAAAGLAAVYLRKVHRFRDPVRVLSAPAHDVVSPADGVVCFVRRVTGGAVEAGPDGRSMQVDALLGMDSADGWLLGIALGPLDVHYTYQPVSGTIMAVTHQGSDRNVRLLNPLARAGLLASRPADLLAHPGILTNERLSISMQAEAGPVTVTVIAAGRALDAMPYVKEGDRARAGYKLAFLPHGGLVVVHLPASLTPLAAVGDHVTGMQTVIARPDSRP